MQFQIRPADFEEIFPIWEVKLWPGRESPIEPFSVISERGLLELDIADLFPDFFLVTDESVGGRTVGVISGCKTSVDGYRSRGLWVDPSYRRLGLGRLLVERLVARAGEEGCLFVWSMPRQSATSFYKKLGFEVYDSTSNYEFGPHHLMKRLLS